jgi:hypothetical protein
VSAEEDIVERGDAWQRAIEARDPEAAAEILADDYALVVTHPEAAVMPREEWLRVLPSYEVSAYEIHDRTVEIREDVAVVVQRIAMTAVVFGVDRSGVFILVDLWVRDAGTWRVWRRHSTPLSAGSLPRA